MLKTTGTIDKMFIKVTKPILFVKNKIQCSSPKFIDQSQPLFSVIWILLILLIFLFVGCLPCVILIRPAFKFVICIYFNFVYFPFFLSPKLIWFSFNNVVFWLKLKQKRRREDEHHMAKQIFRRSQEAKHFAMVLLQEKEKKNPHNLCSENLPFL